MVDYLDPEIAGEGFAADSWTPPIPEARIPDYKGIKKIAKYFPQFTGRPYVHQVFPCWLYHPTKPEILVHDIYNSEDPPRLIKKATEWAAELGCLYRNTTPAEREQGFPNQRWEYSGEWRAKPFKAKHDMSNKTLVSAQANPNDAIAATVAAVLAQLGRANAPVGAPADMTADPKWIEFQAFKAWSEQQEKGGGEEHPTPTVGVANALQPASAMDKAKAIEEAEKRGVEIDRRWSADKIIAELAKVA